jgi:hypothetical protein
VQSPKVPAHCPPHTPPTQAAVVLAGDGQTLLQLLQLLTSLVVSISQPSLASLLQLAWPLSHITTAQAPVASQVGVA